MKSAIIKSLLFLGAAGIFWSCKKDMDRVLLSSNAKGGTLSASTTTPTVAFATADSSAVTFNWTKPDFGTDLEVEYYLQFDKKNGNFSSPAEITVSKSGTKTLKQSELNAMAITLGLVANNSDTIQVRVKYLGHTQAPSAPAAALPVAYSNIVKLVFTPYVAIINYTFPKALRIAGNYQGWNPGTAPSIVDPAATGTTAANYDGYIYFNDPGPQFKMVKGTDWSAGDFGASSSTVLTNGGSNITLGSGAGVYRITANTTAMTWSGTKINTWGIIGDATAGGWGASTPMNFVTPPTGEEGKVKWTITTNLTPGFIKFRANDDWGINFGDNSPRDNRPDYNGDNIPVTVAGNYTITLELLAGNYNYTLRKN